MALLAVFYISTESNAAAYNAASVLPATDRAQHTGITTLELSTLWAIIEGREWDVDMMDPFECILERDGGAVLIHRIPDTFLSRIIGADSEMLRRPIATWCQTEELSCTPRNVQPIVDSLVRLAGQARSTGRNLYLWNSL